MYHKSDQAQYLAALRVNDIPAALADVGVSPANAYTYHRACSRRNAVIDLMMGAGDYADDWSDTPAGDPGYAMPACDDICVTIRATRSPFTGLDPAAMHARVLSIAQGDADHPVALHWRTVREAAHPLLDDMPAWDDVEALVG